MKRTTHHFTGDSPSSSFEIAVYEFGTTGPKIYLQAGMHADEHPGILILSHLIDKLEAAEAEGRLAARFVILPVVNPLGLAWLSHHHHYGRYHLTNGLNYNRGWPDFAKRLADRADFAAGFGPEAKANQAYVRQVLGDVLAEMTPHTALEKQRHLVMSHCYDADMVLDLHCDDEALNHIYIVPQNLPRYQGLADRMGSVATLTAADSGGGSFDEVWSGLWIGLSAAYPDIPLPDPVLSVTLEYRGQGDVFDDMAQDDALNLYDFFCDEGLIEQAPHKALVASASPSPLNGCDVIRVNAPGLVAYKVGLGDIVAKGDVIAELIALDGEMAARQRTPIIAGTDGVVFSLCHNKYVWPGMSIAKIAGQQPLASRGDYLLED